MRTAFLVAGTAAAAAIAAAYVLLSSGESSHDEAQMPARVPDAKEKTDLPDSASQVQEVTPPAEAKAIASAVQSAGGMAAPASPPKEKKASKARRAGLEEKEPAEVVITPETAAEIAEQQAKMQRRQAAQQAKLQKKEEEAKAAAAEKEAVASAGTPFVDAIVNRAVLAQPADLVAGAKPPPAANSDGKKGAAAGPSSSKKSKKEKPKLLSSWAETLIAAVQALEGNTPDSAQQSKALLDAALASASKPGAPKDALPTTLRAIGFSHASTSSLDAAAAAYARALAEAKRRAADSPQMLLGCWRDMAILRRERGEHPEAEACWHEATNAMQAAQAAAAKGIKGGPTNAMLLTQSAARVELELARADCLRDQRRYGESGELITKALKWRERSLGKDAPSTLAAVYDLACCRRTAHVAAAAAGTPMGSGSAPPNGSATEEAGLRRARLDALDAQGSVAADLDERWQQGLRELIAGEPANRFAEHVTMLASVAQLHKNHAEAVYLFRIVVEEYGRIKLAAGDDADAAADTGAKADPSVPLGAVERAELFNSLGESLLEVRHYDAAAPIFAEAKATLEEAEDVEASSVASIEANEARMLSETGRVDAASTLFDKAKETTTRATEDALAAAAETGGVGAEDPGHVMMVHMLHARVLQLYAAHCKAHGREAEGGAMAATVKQLEAHYGFSSQ